MKIEFDDGVQTCYLAVFSKAKPKGRSWERQGTCVLPRRKMGEAKTGMYCVGVQYPLNILPCQEHAPRKAHSLLAEGAWQSPGFQDSCSLKFLSRFSSFGVEMLMRTLNRSVLPFLFTQSVGFTVMFCLNLTENWPYKH